METRASYVIIGAFTLVTFLLGFGFVLWLGKLSLDREWDYYNIEFTEAVTGLSTGGAVQYNGIQVGEVRKLSLAPNDPRRVIARVRVAAGTPVTTDTRAKLSFLGLTGVAVVQLTGGTPQAPRLAAKPGELLPTIVADESALQKLLTSSEDVITSFNDVILRVSALLNQHNLDKVEATLEHIETVTGSVAARSEGLGQAIDDLSKTMAEAQSTMRRLDRAVASAQRLLDDDGKAVLGETRQSLESIRRLTDGANAILEQNREAIAGFSSQGLAQVGPTLAELRTTLRRLQTVIERLEENPSGFLLGKEKPKEYAPE
jgi:phospholipid/cholesterol/gamma-HCH transport system substrate-binding protein